MAKSYKTNNGIYIDDSSIIHKDGNSKKSTLKNLIYTETELYSGSSNGNITLSDSAVNYDILKIYYAISEGSNDVYGYNEILAPNNKRFRCLGMSYDSNDDIHQTYAEYLISGTSIALSNPYNKSNAKAGVWKIKNQIAFTPNYSNTNSIYIKKVIGLKK